MKNGTVSLVSQVLALALAAQIAMAEDAAKLLTKGRVATELGHLEEAAELYSAVDESRDASETIRVEALLGLGQVEQASGRHDASVAAFSEVAGMSDDDPDLRWRLAEAVTRVTPDARAWLEDWREVEFGVGHTKTGDPVAVMMWPSATSLYGKGDFVGEGITMSLKDASLSDVLRMFGQMAGFRVEMGACVDTMLLTVELDTVPWDRVLYDILGSRGLEAELVDGSLTVVCPSRDEIDLPAGMESSQLSSSADAIASVHVSFEETRALSSAGMCGVQPIHDVSLLGLRGGHIPQALARPLLARAAGRGVVKVEICGTAASLEQAGDFQREIHGSKAFFGPTFREVRHGDGGGIDFVMTTFFYVDGGGPGEGRPIDP